MQIFIAILSFCLIIVIHELGHFIAAKLCGIQVNEFALGMGPALFRKKGKETEYVIRVFPIGGFCAMEGETEKSANPRAFNAKPVWQRMAVILAGPLMNLILGFIVALIYICAVPTSGTTTVSKFSDSSLCSNVLQIGDEIVSIENTHIFTTFDIQYKLQTNNGRTDEDGNLLLDFKVKRDGHIVELKDVKFLFQTDENGNPTVIYGFYVDTLKKNFFTVLEYAGREAISTGRLILITVADLFKGKYGLSDLSGPVGSIGVVTESLKSSIPHFLYIFTFITINVGIFNLLPIPALDGCRFVFLVIEAIRRKPLKPEIEGIVNMVGFGLLMALMIVVTFGDISKLAGGGF